MTKIIKVESCAGCDKKQRSAWGWLCPRLEGNIGDKVINDYVEAKTMHPDCVLDDFEDTKLLEGKYYELLHYVKNKYPGESRHDTALRYIKHAGGYSGVGKELEDKRSLNGNTGCTRRIQANGK